MSQQWMNVSQYWLFVFWLSWWPRTKCCSALLVFIGHCRGLETVNCPQTPFLLLVPSIFLHTDCASATPNYAPHSLQMLHQIGCSIQLLEEKDSETHWNPSCVCQHRLWNPGAGTWPFWAWLFISYTNKCTHLVGLLWKSNEWIHDNA